MGGGILLILFQLTLDDAVANFGALISVEAAQVYVPGGQAGQLVRTERDL